jgi:hypothetical protein
VAGRSRRVGAVQDARGRRRSRTGAGAVKTLRRGGGDLLLGRSSSSSSLSLSGAEAVKGKGRRRLGFRGGGRGASYGVALGLGIGGGGSFWASVLGRVAALRRG